MKKILLTLLILLAFLIRIINLENNPPGFFCDEASIGYNAYKILKTGRDEHGESLPIYFRAFGEYKNPVFIYLDIPFVALFGLNEKSVRLLSVFLGTATIIFIYLLTRELFGWKIGFTSTFLLTFSPWHIHYSRIGFELISFPLFFLLSFYVFVLAIKKKSSTFLYFSSLLFGLTVYTYGSARIFIPLFFLGLIFFFRKEIFKPFLKGLIFIIIFILIFLPSLDYIIGERGVKRDPRVLLFKEGKPLSVKLKKVAKAYSHHFQPKWLFFKSETDYPGQFVTRAIPREVSYLFKVLLPFFYLGVIKLILSKKREEKMILFALLLFPLGGALSTYQISSARGIIGVVVLQIISALGIIAFIQFLESQLKFLKRKLTEPILLIILGIILLNFFNYYFTFFSKYPLYAADYWGWQFGPREIISYFVLKEDDYDELFISSEFNGAQIFIPFYTHDHQKGKCLKCEIGGFERYQPGKRQLFALSPAKLKESGVEDKFVVKKKIFYPNGKIAFLIGELYKAN